MTERLIDPEGAELTALAEVVARQFAREVVEAEAALARTVQQGLFVLERELRFGVFEHFDSAERLLETVGGWRGTRIPKRVQARVERAEPAFRVRQRLVLRRLRAL